MIIKKLKHSDKIRLMLWKNWLVIGNSRLQLITVIVTPFLFAILLICARASQSATITPVETFEINSDRMAWRKIFEEIDKRRIKMQQEVPHFNHSVYVPQNIIAYAPELPPDLQKILMAEFESKLQFDGVKKIELLFFEDCTILRQRVQEEHYFAGVCIDDDTIETVREQEHLEFINLTIIMPSELRFYDEHHIGEDWNTNRNWNYAYTIESLIANRKLGLHYIREGFYSLQIFFIDFFILKTTYLKREYQLTKKQQDKYDKLLDRKKGLLRLPVLRYIQDDLVAIYASSLSTFIIFSFITYCVLLVYNMVIEKQTALTSYLNVMGIRKAHQMLAWLIIGFCGMAYSSVVITIVLVIRWNDGAAIMTNTNWVCLMFLFAIYSFTNCCFCIFISAISSNIHFGTPLLVFLWLLLYIPFLETTNNEILYFGGSSIIYFFYNTLMAHCIKMTLQLECFATGLQWSTLIESKLGTHVLVLLIHGIGFFCAGLVLDYFNPGKFGIPWRTPFGLLKDLRKSKNEDLNELKLISVSRNLIQQNSILNSYRRSQRSFSSNQSRLDFDMKITDETTVVEIIGLTKQFGNHKAVINNLAMQVEQGEILVIMGPNGCGKSVLTQMIAGFERPSSGLIYVNGVDGIQRRRGTSKDMGMAFGTLLLLGSLTFSQQIRFRSCLKGMTTRYAQEEINYFIATMQLEDLRHVPTKYLPTSVKYQLAVICALTGTSRVVILDNIDHAMDGSMHNALVDTLIKEKKKRTIVLATNSYRIAEMLADRIAILDGGALKYIGDISYLKEIYGKAYFLICYKSPEGCNIHALTSFLHHYSPEISLAREFSGFVSYALPIKESDLMKEMLDTLEQRLSDFGLSYMAIRETSVQDFFFTISDINQRTGELLQQPSVIIQNYIESTKGNNLLESLINYTRIQGCQLFWQRIHVVLRKFFIANITNRELLVINFLLPIAMSIIGYLSFIHFYKFQELNPREFKIERYDSTVCILSRTTKGFRNDESANHYIELVANQPGNHMLFDFSGQPLPEYLLDTKNIKTHEYMQNFIAGYISTKGFIFILYSTLAQHSIPTSVSLVETALFRTRMNHRTPTVLVSLDPLPYETGTTAMYVHHRHYINRFIIVCIVFALNFHYVFITAIASEDQSATHRLQHHFFGNSGIEYWIGIVFSFSLQTLITLPPIVITLYVTHDGFNQFEYILSLGAVLYLCCLYLTLFKLFFNLLFKSEYYFVFFNCFIIISLQVTVCFFDYFDTQHHMELPINSWFWFLPIFITYETIRKVLIISELHVLCHNQNVHQASLYINQCTGFPNCCDMERIFDSTKWNILTLFIIDVFLFIAVVLLDNYVSIFAVLRVRAVCSSLKEWLKTTLHLERKQTENVNAKPSYLEMLAEKDYNSNERELVKNLNRADYVNFPVVCNDVSRMQNKNKLIDKQCLLLRQKESFALLGPSGCGKTTLLHLITGDLQTKSGYIYCYGKNSINPRRKFREQFGFCPQENISFSYYTICEVLEIFAMLRGVHRSQIKHMCKNLAKRFGLYNDYHKQTRYCSDGIHRRLDIAIALIGTPKLVIFDGSAIIIDPSGKQLLYSAIANLRNMGSTVISTSLNINECGLQCDRLTILLNGQFRVIGTPAEICNEYYRGYIMGIKMKKINLKTNRANIENTEKIRAKAFTKLTEFIESSFANAIFKGEPGRKILFFVPLESATFGDIFHVMISNMNELHLDEFSISNNTLAFMLEDMVYGERTFSHIPSRGLQIS